MYRVIIATIAVTAAIATGLPGEAAATFADGIVVGSAPSCGAGDECAEMRLTNGDRVVVYNAGATHCEPYELRVVRYHGDAVLFSSEQRTNKEPDSRSDFGVRCGRFRTTVLTMTQGHRIVIYQNGDGTLSARWAKEPGLTVGAAQPVYGISQDQADGHPIYCFITQNGSRTRGEWNSDFCAPVRAAAPARVAASAAPMPMPTIETSPNPDVTYSWSTKTVYGHPETCTIKEGSNVTTMTWAADACAPARDIWEAQQK
jgi:hypothetical protein